MRPDPLREPDSEAADPDWWRIAEARNRLERDLKWFGLLRKRSEEERMVHSYRSGGQSSE